MRMLAIVVGMALLAIPIDLAQAVEPPAAPVRPSAAPKRKEPRPVAFETLNFVDETLRLQAEAAHAWAESLAEKNWIIDGYEDIGYRNHPRIVASWSTSKVDDFRELRRHLPYRAVRLKLNGSRDSHGPELIRELHVQGYWMPTKGWGSSVSVFCETVRPNEPHTVYGTVMVTLVGKEQLPSFEAPPAAFRLTNPTFTARASEGPNFAYSYTAVLRSPSIAENRTELVKLYESPESLRDAALKDLEKLRRIAKEQIAQPLHLLVTDSTKASSAQPPIQESAITHPPTAETTAKLLAQIESQIAEREALVHEHFREMHGAMRKALPLEDLSMPLLGQ